MLSGVENIVGKIEQMEYIYKIENIIEFLSCHRYAYTYTYIRNLVIECLHLLQKNYVNDTYDNNMI